MAGFGSAVREEEGQTEERTALRADRGVCCRAVEADEVVGGCLAGRDVESVGMDELDGVRVDLAGPGRLIGCFSGGGGGVDEPTSEECTFVGAMPDMFGVDGPTRSCPDVAAHLAKLQE